MLRLLTMVYNCICGAILKYSTTSYIRRHTQTARHIKRATVPVEHVRDIVSVSAPTTRVRDIELFHTTGRKGSNDRDNKIRENIITDLINKPGFVSSITSDTYLACKWETLRQSLNEAITAITGDGATCIRIERKGGRRYNYDFELFFTRNGVEESRKIEFKYGSSTVHQCPQFLSLYVSSHHLFKSTDSYITHWHSNYLESFLQTLGYDGAVPDLKSYGKTVNNTRYKTPYQAHIKNIATSNAPIDSFKQLMSKRIVNESIATYLQDIKHMKLDHIQSKLLKQSDKIFLFCKDGKFRHSTLSIDSLTLDISKMYIKNTNTVVIPTMDNRFKIEALLRWKNYKGCAGPAWQIALRE